MYEMGISLLLSLVMMCSSSGNVAQAEITPWEPSALYTDEEILDAAARYRRWWETRKYPRTAWTIDPCYDEPLCGSGYRWW